MRRPQSEFEGISTKILKSTLYFMIFFIRITLTIIFNMLHVRISINL